MTDPKVCLPWPLERIENASNFDLAGGQVYGPGTNGEQFPIAARANVALIGQGLPTLAIPSTVHGYEFVANQTYLRALSRVDGIVFQGGSDAVRAGSGIGQSHDLLIERCYFTRQDGAGVLIQTASARDTARVYDCTFDTSFTGVRCLLPSGPVGRAQTTVIEQCRFDRVQRGVQVEDVRSYVALASTRLAVDVLDCQFANGVRGVNAQFEGPCSRDVLRVQRSQFYRMSGAGLSTTLPPYLGSQYDVPVTVSVEDCSFAACRAGVSIEGNGMWTYVPLNMALFRNMVAGPGQYGLNLNFNGLAGTSRFQLSDNLVRGVEVGILAGGGECNIEAVVCLRDRCLDNGTGLLHFLGGDGGVNLTVHSGMFCNNRDDGVSLTRGDVAAQFSSVALDGLTVANNGRYGLFASHRSIHERPTSASHCIFANNGAGELNLVGPVSPVITYSTLQNQSYPGNGNLNLTNPMFLVGYKLNPLSPCIDAGTSSAAPTDYEGGPRSVAVRGPSPLPDHGADEYEPAGSLYRYGLAGLGRDNYWPQISSPNTTAPLGVPFRVDLSQAIDNRNVPAQAAFLSLSTNETLVDLSGLGAPGSWLLNDLALVVGPFSVSGTGSASLFVTLPVAAPLVGVPAHFQWVTVKPLANASGLVTTQGLRVTSG